MRSVLAWLGKAQSGPNGKASVARARYTTRAVALTSATSSSSCAGSSVDTRIMSGAKAAVCSAKQARRLPPAATLVTTCTSTPARWNTTTPLTPGPAIDGSEAQLLEISMGPQHPSTHGVFRMNVVLDGEHVVKLKPIFGYLHRNHEKIAENETYLGSMPYTDRLDYLCSITNNWGYALAVEKLAGLRSEEHTS